MSIKSYTKTQLHDHIAMLEAELAKKGRALDELRLQLSIAQRNAPAPQRQLPLHFVRAREAAMAMGRSVKVQP